MYICGTSACDGANFSSAIPRNISSESPFTKEDPTQSSKRKLKALVVDDATDLLDLLATVLSMAGYEVVTKESAIEALDVAKSDQFDLVISDIGMPEMSGYDLSRQLRTLPGYEAIPMLAVTGFAYFDDRDRALEAGFTDYLKKPIDPLMLIDMVKHLGQKRGS
jgi:CheY-like chemotaxis protein